MTNLEKLNSVLSSKRSNWEDEAKWREANEEWLSQSFDIAVRVLETLKAKGMTQKELAAKMNVSPQFINKVVKGQENLSLETIGKLSQALGIKLIEVAKAKSSTEVEFDAEQAFEVIERYRKEVFRGPASTQGQGHVGLGMAQVYRKGQKLEYKIPA